MDLADFFGIDVKKRFLQWFQEEFGTDFSERFPGRTGLTLVILDNDNPVEARQNWMHPFEWALITAHIGDETAATDDDGTLHNVRGKLRFVLRTGENSVKAEERPDLVRPGDFPYQGAGYFKGYAGGVSGLDREDDWRVFCQCVNKLIELLAEVGAAAVAEADELHGQPDCEVGTKYLYGIDVSHKIVDEEADDATAQAGAISG